MADDIDNNDAVDLGAFVPDTFKGEDGTFDTAGFRAKYDELAAFSATEAERKSALPQDASGYAFALSEDHQWPEGFDPEKLKMTDADGNEVAFDASKLIDAEDPDIPLVQAALHEAGAPPELASKIAGIFANRALRDVLKAAETKETETKALGPDAQPRIDTIKRVLAGKVPAAQANALLDGLTSADAVRGMEALIKAAKIPPAPQGTNKTDHSELSPIERVMLGNRARSA